MLIDAKITEGYVILCNEKSDEHVFIVRNLGPSVECPRCGSTALSGDLATDFVRRNREANGVNGHKAPAFAK